MASERTYRIEDGERIEGSWRPIFIKNGDTSFLTALEIYADGMINAWGLVDLARRGTRSRAARLLMPLLRRQDAAYSLTTSTTQVTPNRSFSIP